MAAMEGSMMKFVAAMKLAKPEANRKAVAVATSKAVESIETMEIIQKFSSKR